MSPAAATSPLADLEPKAARGEAFTRADAERVMACTDLVSIGVLGEAARKAHHGDNVSYVRVAVATRENWPESAGDAGEVRIAVKPTSSDDARACVRAGRELAGRTPLTGFSAADLLELCGGDHLALAELAKQLKAEGLEAVAELPLDRLGDTENVIEVVRALTHGGLNAPRATVDRATTGERFDLIERAAAVQKATSAFKAFAPLPRQDPRDTPSTGYDDVKTIAIARLMCAGIAAIQVDWPLYGPKLAQVAIAYGADDIDGVGAFDDPAAGTRRAPAQDVERQIKSAFASPQPRNGRFEPRS
jgi:aminodeoxyfutalosine synthase